MQSVASSKYCSFRFIAKNADSLSWDLIVEQIGDIFPDLPKGDRTEAAESYSGILKL